MFVGHFGVGFAGKTVAPRASLGTLFLAAQFVDLLWPTLLTLGIERVAIQPGITVVTPFDFVYYPISHSLLTVVGWALLFAVLYYAMRRYPRGAIVVGVLVVSHWLLDAVMHRPDLPLYPGGEARIGLGAMELATRYVRTRDGRLRPGHLALCALDASPGSHWSFGILGLGRLSAPPVRWVRFRRAASEHRGSSLGRAGAVAHRPVGLLAGSPSSSRLTSW